MSNNIFKFFIKKIFPLLLDERFQKELEEFVRASEEKEKCRLRQEHMNKFIRLRTHEEAYYD